jgi:hypothetical protein
VQIEFNTVQWYRKDGRIGDTEIVAQEDVAAAGDTQVSTMNMDIVLYMKTLILLIMQNRDISKLQFI